MKKIYKAPLTEVVKLTVGEMLQVNSTLEKGTTYSGSTVLSKEDADYDEDLW